MLQQDLSRQAAGTHAAELWQAVQTLLGKRTLTKICLRTDCTWTPQALVFGALLWAWSDQLNLTDRFQAARQIIDFLGVLQGELMTSYQAFIKLLRHWTPALRAALAAQLRQRLQTTLGNVWLTAGWAVFAVDGSRLGVPRTRANEARYCSRSKLSRANQKRSQQRRTKKQQAAQRALAARTAKAGYPSLWLTVLWHAGSGLLWDWRSGPADSSERAHLLDMLHDLPKQALLTADAGFVGYDFWSTVRAAGVHLLVRVGSNVKLLKKLGHAQERVGTVYLWPDQKRAYKQPPLRLRLIVVNNGRQPMYLVTDLPTSQLSDQQAARIYQQRWGVELFFRHCKQTFARAKLRSQNPDNASVELEWSLLGMWLMGVQSHERLLTQGVVPNQISFVKVLRSYRTSLREYRMPIARASCWQARLDVALIDGYTRKTKASRHYPRKRKHSVCKPPTITNATHLLIIQARKIGKGQELRLTA